MTIRPLHLLLTLPIALGSCDILLDTDGGNLGISFTSQPVPLLPVGFPIYPKAFSTTSLSGLVEQSFSTLSYQAGIDDVADDICATVSLITVCLDDLISPSDYAAIDAAIANEVPEIHDWAEQNLMGQLKFFNAAPLGVGINEQIGRIFRGAVTFNEVKLHMTVTNRTDELWGVPIRFSMYMGNGESVANKSALVTVAEGDKFTFMLQPGESKTVETDNLLDLVNALNDVKSLAMDYDADIEVADIDPNSFQQWLGVSRSKDEDKNGIADDLAKWGLIFEDLRIEVSGRGEVDIPIDVPGWLYDYVPEGVGI